MKKSILIISALLMVSVCWGKNTPTQGTDAVVAEPSDAKKEIVAFIHELYSTIAKKENVSIDERFACHAWRDMVAAVNVKDEEVEEIGFFNDDYWTMMQDGIPDDLEARDIDLSSWTLRRERQWSVTPSTALYRPFTRSLPSAVRMANGAYTTSSDSTTTKTARRRRTA